MRPLTIATATVLLIVVCGVAVVRRSRQYNSAFDERNSSRASSVMSPESPVEPPLMLRDVPSWTKHHTLSRSELVARLAAMTKTVADPVKQPIARDGFYDRLLARQGRDPVRERQLQAKLVDVFDEGSETLVGPIACSSEFCRVELQGAGTVDVRDRWKQELFSAVEPKGFRFFVVDQDESGNTVADLYFGRSDSWTVPDFHALGLL